VWLWCESRHGHNIATVYQEQSIGIAIVLPRSEESPDGTLSALSSRELEALQLVARGAKNRQIANALGLSVHTVKRHIARIMIKLQARSRTEAASHYRGKRHGDVVPASPVDVALLRRLTPREFEVFQRIANGFSAVEIARELSISLHTVKRHTSSIFEKLAVQNRSHAAAFAHATRGYDSSSA
jgi:DNA-binding NarL/FixJ family response regulator